MEFPLSPARSDSCFLHSIQYRPYTPMGEGGVCVVWWFLGWTFITLAANGSSHLLPPLLLPFLFPTRTTTAAAREGRDAVYGRKLTHQTNRQEIFGR